MDEEMCTVEKQGNLYILTLSSNNEHRLNPTRINAIRSSISKIKSESLKSKSPTALITTAHGKFFSNGYDLDWATSTGNFKKAFEILNDQFKTLMLELISLPMPTIATVTGQAAGAAMIFTVAHDFVVMRRDKGVLYMSEVDIGMVIPRWFMTLLSYKIGGWERFRRVVLGAKKVTGEKANEMGNLWEVFDGVEATVEGAVEMGEEVVKRGWDGRVYSENRMVLLKEVVGLSGGDQSGDGKAVVVHPRL